MRKIILPLTVIVGLMVGCNSQSIELDDGIKPEPEPPKETVKFESDEEERPLFMESELRESVIETMLGVSLPNREYADNLKSLMITYIDFTGTTKHGALVVNKEVAKEVLEIFEEVYNKGYRIETMDIIEKYDGDDNRSMLANNTSAFNYRTIAGTDILSNHAGGYAIDINPYMNPHVINGVANPKESQMYADRSLDKSGMIKEGDALYEAFTSRGWEWGGHWENPDYQHFEKGK